MDPKNINSQQRELLKAISTNKENLLYEWDEVRGALSFVRADSLSAGIIGATNGENNYQQVLNDFLKTYGHLFGPQNITDGLQLILNKQDNIGWRHYQFQHYYTGVKENEKTQVEVYASKLAAHFRPDGTLVEVQSS
ncbi:MAG: M4 family metallopeptidase, partial [Minisyncoccia bacterium]